MEKVWYYMKQDRTKYGPYTDHELASLISKGLIGEEDWIWMPALTSWMKLRNTIYSFYIYESSEFENDFNI